MVRRGEHVDFDELLQQLNERDRRDSTRRIGRMHKADDAIEVDTNGMTFEQVVDRLEEIVRSRQTADA
jgi:cytidylate kinase